MSKSKKSSAPAVLVVRQERHTDRSLHPKIIVSAGTLERDDEGREVVRHPDAVGGIHCGNGSLTWRFYRHNPYDSYDRERGAHKITASCVGASYEHVYYVGLSDAEAMVRGLKLLGKRLDALREKFGSTDDFAETVLRIADVFGAKQIAVAWDLYTEATGNKQPEHLRDADPAQRAYHLMELRYARGYLDAVANIDVTARCGTCKVPVNDGQTRCYEHKEPLEQVAHDKLNPEAN